MAGYKGYSMSNNAVESYRNGERPKSKWTKKEIVDELEGNVSNEKLDAIKKMDAASVKNMFLKKSSKHHTSKMYNYTDFYSIDLHGADNATLTTIQKVSTRTKDKPKKEVDVGERYEVSYLEWSGTKKHPKATRVDAVGIKRGNWVYLPDGRKKSVDSKGFELKKKITNYNRSVKTKLGRK